MSIAWLNVIANEIVSVLQSLGLLATVSTGTFAVGTLNTHVFVAVTSVCSLNVPVRQLQHAGLKTHFSVILTRGLLTVVFVHSSSGSHCASYW